MECRKYLNYYWIKNKPFNKLILFEELLHRKSICSQIKGEKLEKLNEPLDKFTELSIILFCFNKKWETHWKIESIHQIISTFLCFDQSRVNHGASSIDPIVRRSPTIICYLQINEDKFWKLFFSSKKYVYIVSDYTQIRVFRQITCNLLLLDFKDFD